MFDFTFILLLCFRQFRENKLSQISYLRIFCAINFHKVWQQCESVLRKFIPLKYFMTYLSTDYLKVGKSRQHLFDSEGLENPGGRFHSRVPHLPPGASGVTIGRGYDMKSRSKQSVIRDLKNTGMSESDAKRLAEGVGLTGQAAKKFIKASLIIFMKICLRVAPFPHFCRSGNFAVF